MTGGSFQLAEQANVQLKGTSSFEVVGGTVDVAPTAKLVALGASKVVTTPAKKKKKPKAKKSHKH